MQLSPSGRVMFPLLLLCLISGGSKSGSGMQEVFPSRFGTFNFDELEYLDYDLEITSLPVPEEEASGTEVGGKIHPRCVQTS